MREEKSRNNLSTLTLMNLWYRIYRCSNIRVNDIDATEPIQISQMVYKESRLSF